MNIQELKSKTSEVLIADAEKLGTNKRSPKFFRIINEIPTVLLIFIVFVIIFKPL